MLTNSLHILIMIGIKISLNKNMIPGSPPSWSSMGTDNRKWGRKSRSIEKTPSSEAEVE